jgi:3-phosphoshikimate 1-carboxyvinyltransferase
MSHIIVRPGQPLRGEVYLPGDKSISHRALLLGAIAAGTSPVRGILSTGDCQATLRAVRALGVQIETPSPSVAVIHGLGLHGLEEPGDVLNCARSGTTLRLLAGLLAGQPFTSVLGGDGQLLRRPMGRIAEPLRRMGATVLGRDGGRRPPLTIHGGNLQGIEYELPVASAQVKGALLLAGLYASGKTVLHVPGPARDHTERMLLAMGCDLALAPDPEIPSPQYSAPGIGNRESGTGYRIPDAFSPMPASQFLELRPPSRLAPLDLTVPGDLSSASFLTVAAALVAGSRVTLRGVGINATRTGLLDVLEAMGAEVRRLKLHDSAGEPGADLVVRAADLAGVEVGGAVVLRAIDELPLLAVAASQAQGETVVRDAGELRVKETDRIATTVKELRRLGADIEDRPDGFVLRGPTQLQGARVHSHGDHRLAMALCVAGLVARGETRVEATDCIADSFPDFAQALARLGADLR